MKTVASRRRDDVVKGGLLGANIPPSFDEVCATKLYQAIAAARKIQRDVNMKAWVREFTILHREVNDKARIKAALIFYMRHLGEPYIPAIYSANAFRLKFLQLEHAMGRRQPTASSATELPPEWNDVLATLQGQLVWVKGTAAQLPAVLAASVEAYDTFRRKVQARVLSSEEGSKPRRLGERLLAHLITPPRVFLDAWFRNVAQRTAKWPDWNGDLTPYTFRPDHLDFQRQGRSAVSLYNGRPQEWDDFIHHL